MENKKNRDKCEQYRMDIVDYATGEKSFLTENKVKELFGHLKKCVKCREAFEDYEDIYALSVTESHIKSPEFRKKMDGLIAQFNQTTSLPTLPPARNTDWEMGLAAREIYNCLKENGPITIPLIRVKTRLPNYPFRESVGWLAREKKITIHGDPITGYAVLNPGA